MKKKMHVEIVTRPTLILVDDKDGAELESYALPDPEEIDLDDPDDERCSSDAGRELDALIEKWEKGYRVDLGDSSGLISEYLYEGTQR